MVKLAKKSWVCNQCVACVKVEFPIQNDFVVRCVHFRNAGDLDLAFCARNIL